MTFKVFVSHTDVNKNIASEVTRVINNAFGGDIELFVAYKEIRGGDEWKKVIKENLRDSNAILCIVTNEYIDKPWLFIEWSAFWLADKKYYILLTEDVNTDKLVHPMQDRQVTRIDNDESIKKLFHALAEDSGHATIPYKYVSEFINAAKGAIELRNKEKAEESFGKYNNSLAELPGDDAQKAEVADYLYQNKNFINYHKVVENIRDDSIKLNLAIRLVKLGDFENLSELVEKLISADNLTVIALSLIDLNYHDEKFLKHVIEIISTKNQAELRKISIHLANRNEDNSYLFAFTIEHLTNMAELRKIAVFFLENGKTESQAVVKLIKLIGAKNQAELRKVALSMLDLGLQHTSIFTTVFEVLCGNQREAEKFMTDLYQIDKELFNKFIDTGLIVNKVSLNRLMQLGEK